MKLSHEIETWNRRNKAEAARRPSMEDASRESLGRTCKPNVDWATATCHRGTADGTQPTATGFPASLPFLQPQSSARRLPHLAQRYCRLSRVPTTVLRSPPRILPAPAMVGGPISRAAAGPLDLPRSIAPRSSLLWPATSFSARPCPQVRLSFFSLCCKRYGICEWWWPRFV